MCLRLPRRPGGAVQPAAQAQSSKLLVTVADPSGGVIPGATVDRDTAGRAGEGRRARRFRRPSRRAAGLATIDGLAPGRYTITAEFAGFETVILKDYRVRAGENKRGVVLPVKKVAEDVVVGRDKQTAGLDPRGNAFSTVLTREQIAALPDDPDEMEAALKAMSPPGAVMRIDGFTGGKLPPKSQIRSIRLPRMDQMAAQNHGGINGMMHIDVMTQPGNGPIARLDRFRVPRRRAECEESVHAGQRRGGHAAGHVLAQRIDRAQQVVVLALDCSRRGLFDSGNILAAVPDGTVARAIRRPTDRTNINARFDQAHRRRRTC